MVSSLFFVPCGVVADGHHKQRAILRRNQIPGWGGHCNIYRSSAECFQLPEAPDGATALGGLPWSGWLGGLKMFQICCIFDMSIIWRYLKDKIMLNQYLLSNRGTACCICCAQSKSSQGIAMCHDRLVHTHDISWRWWWWWWRRWWSFQV